MAHRDAQLAAEHAFNRASERSAADPSLFPPPLALIPRSTPSNSLDLARKDHHNKAGVRGLERQRSVRFVGPCSIHGRTSSKTQGACGKVDIENSPSTSVDIKGYPSQAHDIPAPMAIRNANMSSNIDARPTVASAAARRTNMHSSAIKHLKEMAAEEERYTAEDDIASAPSSYRRLRKSKSMFTSVQSCKARDAMVTDAAPLWSSGLKESVIAKASLPIAPAQGKNMHHCDVKPAIRAPKSMSFLRSHTQTEHNESTTDDGSSVRSAYPRPSLLFGARNRTTGTFRRKSLRNNNSESCTQHISSAAISSYPRDGEGREIKRKVSKSLKSRLKGFFKPIKLKGNGALPEQHIESRKTHGRSNLGSIVSDCHSGHGSLGSSNGSLLHQVSSKLPSIHSIASAQQLHSSKGSLESLRSDPAKTRSDEKSRVTSWSDSGPSSLTSQQQQQWFEWERQRLSVIGENGTHAPSPSLRRPPPPIPKPQPPDSSPLQSQTSAAAVDSQRVYSALVKRLHETTQLANVIEKQRRKSTEHATSLQGTAMGDTYTSQSDPVTIRHVDHGNCPVNNIKASTSKLVARKPLVSDAASSGKSQHNNEARSPDCTLSAGSISSMDLKSSASLCPPPAASKSGEIVRTLSDRGSAFFGSPTSYLFRTRSPYRRALQQSIEENGEIIKQPSLDGEGDSSFTPPQHRNADTPCSEAETDAAYSESIYSSATNERTVSRGGDYVAPVEDFVQPSHIPAGLGHMRDITVPGRPTSHRVTSSASSVDWKTWLSANVAKLEPTLSPMYGRRDSPAGTDQIQAITPEVRSGGHIRERAQAFNEDDSEDVHPVVSAHKSTLPKVPPKSLVQNAPRFPSLPHSPYEVSSSMGANLYFEKENEDPNSISAQLRGSILSKPPPIPARSARRVASPSVKSQPATANPICTSIEEPETPSYNPSVGAQQARSLDRLRSLNRIRATNNSTGSPRPLTDAKIKLQKRNVYALSGKTTELMPTYGSGFGLSPAVLQQIGGDNGNVNPKPIPFMAQPIVEDDNLYGGPGSITEDLESDKQKAGKKRVLDLFLSSRRRGIAGNDESAAFV